MTQFNETFPQNNEHSKNQEQLEALLKEARTKLADEEKRAGDFYDVELYRVFDEAIKHFNLDYEAVRLYLNSINENYEKAEENQDKKILFDKNYIKPIKEEIREIENSLRTLKNKDYRLQQEQAEKELQQKEEGDFNKEKGQLEEKLFTALETIHAQIPQEAKDLGMSTESALKVYLPELVDRAQTIEYSINQLSEVTNTYALNRLKKDIDFSSIKNL